MFRFSCLFNMIKSVLYLIVFAAVFASAIIVWRSAPPERKWEAMKIFLFGFVCLAFASGLMFLLVQLF